MATVVANGTQAAQLPMWTTITLSACRTALAMLAGVALLALLLGHAMWAWIATTTETADFAMRAAIT